MKRRDFGKVLSAGVAVSAVSHPKTTCGNPGKALMHVGCQSGGTTKENLEFKKKAVSKAMEKLQEIINKILK